MNTTLKLSLAAAAVSLAGAASPAFAGNTLEDTHAYLEAERAMTEGESDGVRFAPKHGIEERTALDRWFASERARTEGQADRAFSNVPAAKGITSAVHSWFDSERARTEG
ncbi:MAG: hypothetical protein IPH30_11185 [Betaproteobacteria bacterium]|nr:hypothetical protein [Betaproteobacteria bacterium]